jgi:serine/threonine protein kinase
MRSLQQTLPGRPVDSSLRGAVSASPVYPRLVFLEGPVYVAIPNRTVDDTDLHLSESTQPMRPANKHLEDCVPLAAWMTASYPNCNHFHELSLPGGMDSTYSSFAEENALSELGNGWFRTTWRWDRPQESVVLKTLRIEREFLNEYYDLHNRDAVAMERLTASPVVVDVFGYCGQSAINELADFPIPDMQYLEKLSRRMRGKYDHESMFLRLGLAAGIAKGLADVHRAGGDGRPMMAHYDINPRNIALFQGARAKINDFNIAEFLHYNPQTNKTCGFPSRMHAPWWRAPEEVDLENQVLLDEKVDVYAMGSTLFHLFTSYSPRGKMIGEREELVRNLVKKGKRPVLFPQLRNSTDSIAATFREVLDRCHEPNPIRRASSREIAEILMSALVREREHLDKALASSTRGDRVKFVAAPGNETDSEDVDPSELANKG